MSYTIKDIYHKLVIRLTSQLQQSTSDISIEVYKSTNTTTTADFSTNPTYDNGIYTFEIPFSNFQVGDVLDRFKVISENTSMQQLNEGISIFVNGVETDVIPATSENLAWTHTFTQDGDYDIQAIFKGNSILKPSFSEIETINVEPKDTSHDDGTGLTGAWKLTCLTSKSSFTYGDKDEITFRLTKGDNPAPDGKIVELSEPIGTVNSKQTKNGNGVVSFSVLGSEVGDYNVVARFYDYTVQDSRQILTSCTKKISVKKATPTITFNPNAPSDGHARFYVYGVNGTKLKGYKCSVWVNGKKKTTTLTANGNIGFNLKKKGTYKLKVYVNASKNYKAASLERTVTRT